MNVLPASMTQRHLRAVAACMKNEGQFLLEWVAYYRSIGFDRVFLITNDCSDGTDDMADRLSELDDVIHIRNAFEPGSSAQIAGMAAALAHPAMSDVEWLLHCDADEFLDVTCGDESVDALISTVGTPCDAIAICWRHAGSEGRTRWERGSVIATHRHFARRPTPTLAMHKTLFRPDRFISAIDHMPKGPKGRITLRNTAGARMNPRSLKHPTRSRYRGQEPDAITWENASLIHYATRSEDLFVLKNVRGDGMGRSNPRYQLGSPFWRRANHCDEESVSMHRRLAAVRMRIAQFRQDDKLAALDDAAWAWFETMRDTHLTEPNLRAWRYAAPATETP